MSSTPSDDQKLKDELDSGLAKQTLVAELPASDSDPTETSEWLTALSDVMHYSSKERAGFLLKKLMDAASDARAPVPAQVTTPYRNTIAPEDEKPLPGDMHLERRIRACIRWNAMAMVVRANASDDELGGHISSFSSAATLYEIGFNHFFRGFDSGAHGDLVYYQGHISPGIYARSFMEGRFSEEDLDRFRREVDGGLSSYPHPWLMPEYWQFPTVSMGLGPIQAIYQAHVMKYLSQRDLVPMGDRKVWAFLGDGETDEPESLGAIALAGREKLSNLIFVVNCNLQRLDGPVRGNSKIVQELEGVFRGAGWQVIKVLWGRQWDPLLAKDKTGLLQQRMEEVCDGELQNFKQNGGAYTREHFFGKYPELLELVEDMSDEQIGKLNRGGHDPYKVYAAYAKAVEHTEGPTVILAQTVKGYGTGDAGEANNVAHSLKKLGTEGLKKFRDHFDIPLSDDELKDVPYYKPGPDSAEITYMLAQRKKLGGLIPVRQSELSPLQVPDLSTFDAQLKGSGDRSASTTMAFVRFLSTLVKDKQIGKLVVPIVPDEARTFGMEGMFGSLGIYTSQGQRYTPHDAGGIMPYHEKTDGQILEEGITEAGAFSAWIAAATSYSTNNQPLVPFYIFYSMFGFQRIGDLAWAAGDSQARGFLIGATSGRTTLNGEGLQHQDGHSHLLAGTIPNCVSYDPTFAYELAVIIQDGMKQMFEQQRNCFYYITTLNENYPQPDRTEDVDSIREGIVRGIYQYSEADDQFEHSVDLLGSGAILREAIAASELLSDDWGVGARVWSVTSFNELARDGISAERHNLMNPEAAPKTPYITEALRETTGPYIAATDYVKTYPEQVRAFIPGTFKVLGTDGFGRSDTRKKLRAFFEVDRYYIVFSALSALCETGKVERAVVLDAMNKYGISGHKPDPITL